MSVAKEAMIQCAITARDGLDDRMAADKDAGRNEPLGDALLKNIGKTLTDPRIVEACKGLDIDIDCQTGENDFSCDFRVTPLPAATPGGRKL